MIDLPKKRRSRVDLLTRGLILALVIGTLLGILWTYLKTFGL